MSATTYDVTLRQLRAWDADPSCRFDLPCRFDLNESHDNAVCEGLYVVAYVTVGYDIGSSFVRLQRIVFLDEDLAHEHVCALEDDELRRALAGEKNASKEQS